MNTDGRVDCRQHDGGGNNRSNEFPGTDQRGLYRRFSHAQMAFDIFYHDDGVVDHQPDGQYDGKQCQQVDAESENLHEKQATDQRQRDGHHGNKG